MPLQMPHRSVTRFFIPLIDVLILLFCIFLLMEFNSETKYEQQSADVEKQSAAAHVARSALTSQAKEIQRLEERLQVLRDQDPKFAKSIEEYEALKAELDRLKKLRPQDRIDFRIIDIDPDQGTISWYDGKKAEPIPDAKAAKALIARHRKQAGLRELHYHFYYPPKRKKNVPGLDQEEDYADWFRGVSNSLPPALSSEKKK